MKKRLAKKIVNSNRQECYTQFQINQASKVCQPVANETSNMLANDVISSGNNAQHQPSLLNNDKLLCHKLLCHMNPGNSNNINSLVISL